MTQQDNKTPQEKERMGQIKNLVMLAAADGRVDDSELAVIMAVASREDISVEDFNKVIDDPENINIEQPQDDATRQTYLRDMVALMMIDGKLDEQELSICKVYAMWLGYRSTVVDEMIETAIRNLSQQQQ